MNAAVDFQDRALVEAEASAPVAITGNPSGIHPAGDKVLVLPDEVEQVTKGGIIIAPAHVERSQMARTLGTFVAAGPKAWMAFGPDPWAKSSDRVMFARFGGIQVKGKDGRTYRILNDIDITATVDEGVTVGGSEL